MKRFLPYILGIISGIIFASTGTTNLPSLILLIGYVPLLYAEDMINSNSKKYILLKVFAAAFCCFLTTNIMFLWWLEKLLSHWAVLFLIYNAALFSVVFCLFSGVKRRLGNIWGYIAFIAFTVAFEYLSFHLTFPGILAGTEIFGMGSVYFTQWYEYTGVLGGSVWVLTCNVLCFLLIKNFKEKSKLILGISLLSAVSLPIIISLCIYHSTTEKHDPLEVVVVQPNIDPYHEKFSSDMDSQLESMLKLAHEKITPGTDYVLFPETALHSCNIWLNIIAENKIIHTLKDSLLTKYPRAKIIAGADMMEYYQVKDTSKPVYSARRIEGSDNIYYNFFNTAIQIDTTPNIQVYKKSKLVPGTEYVPLVRYFPKLEELSMRLGGSSDSRGTQPHPSIFTSANADVATVICYESLYGGYVAEFVKLGAEAIFIITNDGWWDNTPGAKLHFRFAQLRALENRRAVVRCGNTGISAYIDQRGEIIEQSEWWKAESMNNTINKNSTLTFYTKHGDYIGKICLVLSVFILFFAVFVFFRQKRKKTDIQKG